MVEKGAVVTTEVTVAGTAEVVKEEVATAVTMVEEKGMECCMCQGTVP